MCYWKRGDKRPKEAAMRHLRVEYQDNTYDYVPDWMLGDLIASNRIKRFFRPGDKKWVTPGVDAVRDTGRVNPGLETTEAESPA